NSKGADFDRLVSEEFEPRLLEYQREALRGELLQPRIVYGYFHAAGLGDDVILYDDGRAEVARFTFPRQAGAERLSLADYLREPNDGGPSDVVALQIVTVGANATARTEALQAAGNYGESYYLHGFSVQAAEALAEFSHRRIRRELGIAEERG